MVGVPIGTYTVWMDMDLSNEEYPRSIFDFALICSMFSHYVRKSSLHISPRA